jgi:hypothetical protein
MQRVRQLSPARLALVRHRFAAVVGAAGLVLVVAAGVVAWLQHLESVAHAERTAAVRDFMFDLVNDAEAVEGHEGEEVTGRQMIEGAVIRARRDFGGQPQLQGELLGELGRMYIRLGATDAAVPVLTESVAVLEQHAPPDDRSTKPGRSWPMRRCRRARTVKAVAGWQPGHVMLARIRPWTARRRAPMRPIS